MKAQINPAKRHEPAKRGRFTTAMVGLVAGLALLGNQNADAGQNIMPIRECKTEMKPGLYSRLKGKCIVEEGTELLRMPNLLLNGHYQRIIVSKINGPLVEISMYDSMGKTNFVIGELIVGLMMTTERYVRMDIVDAPVSVKLPWMRAEASRGYISQRVIYLDISWTEDFGKLIRNPTEELMDAFTGRRKSTTK